jgi:hypothetical protein
VNIITMLYYTPNMDQDCPTWVYWTWAVGLFLYQTFDAVDGTQAYVQDRQESSHTFILTIIITGAVLGNLVLWASSSTTVLMR